MNDVVVAVALALLFLAITFKPLFKNLDGFAQCITDLLNPETSGFLRWLTWEQMWHQIKLTFWLAAGFGVGHACYHFLTS